MTTPVIAQIKKRPRSFFLIPALVSGININAQSNRVLTPTRITLSPKGPIDFFVMNCTALKLMPKIKLAESTAACAFQFFK